MALRVAELLAANDDLPTSVRDAIADGRMNEAGLLLMDSFDLSCEEVSALVDRDLCPE